MSRAPVHYVAAARLSVGCGEEHPRISNIDKVTCLLCLRVLFIRIGAKLERRFCRRQDCIELARHGMSTCSTHWSDES